MFDTYTLTIVVVGGGQRAYLLLATTFGPHDKRTGPTLTRLMDCYVVRQAERGWWTSRVESLCAGCVDLNTACKERSGVAGACLPDGGQPGVTTRGGGWKGA